ncbi:MAG TPA: hypothetical protein VFJ01_10355 [Oleiagrimonas sp.]|nr:hypothetical protein [Oleiagrimonas sp.]
MTQIALIHHGLSVVIPAKAGIHVAVMQDKKWIPAFAGMTVWKLFETPCSRAFANTPTVNYCNV